MQAKLQAEQNNFEEFQNLVEQERREKTKIIKNLTEENVHLVNELRERDSKLHLLDTKMNEVQIHVQDVTAQLNTYLEENRELR